MLYIHVVCVIFYVSWSNSKSVFAVLELWRSLSLGILKRSGLTLRAYNHLTLRSYFCEGITPGKGSCSENIPISQRMKQCRSPPKEKGDLTARVSASLE